MGEDALTENAKEYALFANLAKKEGKFNTSVVLYFKVISALVDLYILRKEDQIPSSHRERFRILREKYRQIYEIVDSVFSYYQDTYTLQVSEEAQRFVEENAKKLAKIVEVDL